MAPVIPPFDAAVEQFRSFIAQVGHSQNKLAWLFREDVSTHRRRVLLKLPLPPGNEEAARSRYERGRVLGIGVCLSVFCRLGSALCCYAWWVRDWEEAARRLCCGLKLSVPAPADLVLARPVRSRLVWAVRRRLDGWAAFNQFKEFLPSREELQDPGG